MILFWTPHPIHGRSLALSFFGFGPPPSFYGVYDDVLISFVIWRLKICRFLRLPHTSDTKARKKREISIFPARRVICLMVNNILRDIKM